MSTVVLDAAYETTEMPKRVIVKLLRVQADASGKRLRLKGRRLLRLDGLSNATQLEDLDVRLLREIDFTNLSLHGVPSWETTNSSPCQRAFSL